MYGLRITFAAPTSASGHSPAQMLWQARCTAVSDEEQAVSTVRLGPGSRERRTDDPDAA
jgi:hypothetical protein